MLKAWKAEALHYVCLREKIPFLQLRSVSNDIGVRDKTKWDIKKAIGNLNDQLIPLLKKLSAEDKTVPSISRNDKKSMKMTLTLGFSPCPNDTFIFDALVNKKIDTEGLDFEVRLEDVETLNQWALQGKLDISKISYGVLPLVLDRYDLLDAGGALGKGVGPLLIAKSPIPLAAIPDSRIAIPGQRTTAHLLFSLAFPDGPEQTVHGLFRHRRGRSDRCRSIAG